MTRQHPPPAPTVSASPAEGAPDRAGPDPLLELVQAGGRGDRDALARLLSLVAPSIVATVRVLAGGTHADIEDAAQEALIAIADSVPRFRGESTFLHYARRIAVRTALAMRRARREGARKLADLAAAPLSEAPPSAASPADADAGVEREQRLEAFLRLLDELPQGQAESLTYRVLLEYPLPVIARETGVPVNTVRSRIRLARDHLRDRILEDPALCALLREEAT